MTAAFALGPCALQAGYRLAIHDTLASTNSEALSKVRGGESGPLWIVARRQTAGRGRRGRDWLMQDGNLAASLLIGVKAAPAMIATLGFAAGLTVLDALKTCSPSLIPKLKWPNDILVDGAKLAGILLESEPMTDGFAIVVGIGVNVATFPSDLPYPATSLAACGATISAQHLFMAISDAWIENMKLWNDGEGMPQVRTRWLAHAAGLGDPIAVQSGETIVRGTFETIDAQGRLIVRSPDNTMIAITAGDIHLGAHTTHASVREQF